MRILKIAGIALVLAFGAGAAHAATYTSVGGCDTVVLNPDDSSCYGFVTGNIQQASFDPNFDTFNTIDSGGTVISSMDGLFGHQDWQEIQRDDSFGDVQSGSFTIADNDYSIVSVLLKTGNQWSAHLFDTGLSGLLSFTTAQGTGGLSNYLVVGRAPEIPLPAAGFLLVAGLGALGLMRRRKQNAG